MTTPRNDKYWMLAALAFGLLALPFLVHQTGLRVFGPYADGGASDFFRDYLRGLGTLRWYSWALALGPLVIVAMWRGVGRLGAGGVGPDRASDPSRRKVGSARDPQGHGQPRVHQ